MKKLSNLLLVLSVLVFSLSLIVPLNTYGVKAADKIMEKYFPKGI